MLLPHSFILLLLAALASGAFTNTTFDDSSSSFTFSEGWTAITPTEPCHGCQSKPDPLQTYGGTWHNGNYRDGASSPTTGSFTFTGSAVYIFGIDQDTTQPDITFTLGSVQQVHHYTGTERFVYHALFFAAEGLAPDQTQTVNWVFNLADTSVGLQVALFDYAIVTTGQEDVKITPSATVNTNTNTNTISTLISSASPVSQSKDGTSQSNSGTTQSKSGENQTKSGESQTKSGESQLNPTASPVNEASSPTVTLAGGMTTVTAQPANASSKSKSNLSAIIGGVVGALAVATLAILLVWLRFRKVRRVKHNRAARTQFLRIEDSSLHTRQADHPIPVSLSTSGSKGQNIPETALAGASTTSLLPLRDGSSAGIPVDSSSSSPSALEPPVITSDGAASRNLRLMEERLATLEAQVAVHQQPPPYIQEDDE